MRHFLLLLFSLLQLTAFSQTKVTGTFQVDLSGYYTKSQVDSVVKKSGGVVVPPKPLTPCDRGPEILDVFNATPTSAMVRFDANNVTKILYTVRSIPDALMYTDSIEPKSNTILVPFRKLEPGNYVLTFTGKNCASTVFPKNFTIQKETGGVVDPPIVQPPVPVTLDNFGTEAVKIGGRTFTFVPTPVFELKFNVDGTVSDGSKGLEITNGIHRKDGKNVFYVVGGGHFSKQDGSYEGFQNIRLPDDVYSIKQYLCDPVKIPTYEHFKKYLIDNSENGVNELTSTASQITLSVFSDEKIGNGITPKWLVASRKMNAPKYLEAKDWYPYRKWIFIGSMNKGDLQSVYQRVGLYPYVRPGDKISQARTGTTFKVEQDRVLSADEAYAVGRAWASYLGSSEKSYLSDEVPENGQNRYGKNGAITDFEATYHVARGEYDEIRAKTGLTNKKDMGIFGSYGSYDFHGLHKAHLLFGDRKLYEQSLTTALYKGYGDRGGNRGYGFSDEDHEYFRNGHINYSNVNIKYYFWNRIYYLASEIIAANEYIKLSTKTYQGQDRESNMTWFTADKIESFTKRQDRDEKINIEETFSGEIINFPNGQFLSKLNTEPAAMWDEMFKGGFWSTLVASGWGMWSAPGTYYGSDPTKVHSYSDQFFGWRIDKNGFGFARFAPGVNGAPENSPDGMMNSIFAAQFDAAAAGSEEVWKIRNRIQKLSWISYESSLGSFIVKPGTTGYHLNGFGPPNFNSFTVRDAFEQKKAICIVGEGTEGAVLIYQNDHLSVHNYEDNVRIRYNGTVYDLGRVHGHQIVIKKI